MLKIKVDDFEKVISEFYNKLLNSQTDLNPEFSRVIEDNYWELLERSDSD